MAASSRVGNGAEPSRDDVSPFDALSCGGRGWGEPASTARSRCQPDQLREAAVLKAARCPALGRSASCDGELARFLPREARRTILFPPTSKAVEVSCWG
jgi:hypothetical protein